MQTAGVSAPLANGKPVSWIVADRAKVFNSHMIHFLKTKQNKVCFASLM